MGLILCEICWRYIKENNYEKHLLSASHINLKNKKDEKEKDRLSWYGVNKPLSQIKYCPTCWKTIKKM